MKLVSIYILLCIFPCNTFVEKEKYNGSSFHCLNSNCLLFSFCSLNKYHNKLQEYNITSLLGQNIFALQMNVFYIYLLATQMATPIDNFSGKVIIINILV